jgi:transcriptional regulator with XRE-family HTH domain
LVEGPGYLFGEVLRELLESHEMSAIELARRVSRTPSHVTNYVYGLANPSPASIDGLIAGLDASEREAYRLHLAAARDRGYRI